MKILIHWIHYIVKKYKEHQISAMSTKLTFYTLLSAVPFMICLLEIVRLTKISDTGLFYDLASIVPTTIVEFVQLMFEDIQNANPNGILPFAFIIALWSSSRGVNALIHSLNMSYDVVEKRNYVFIRFISFLYTIAFIGVLILLAGLTIFGSTIYHTILAYVTLPSYFGTLITFARYLVSIIIVIFFLVGFYNITPNTKMSIKDVLPGTFFSAIGIILISGVFSFYVNNSFSLSYLYGSLTNIVIVMLWLYVLSNILIIGGEINAMFKKLKNNNNLL